MLEARALSPSRSVCQSIKDFLARHTINITSGLLFLLLTLFLLWPVFSVLLKSVYDPDGFTLQYYKDFVTKSYYYRSLFNSLVLGIITTMVCVTVGFCIAYVTTRGPKHFRAPLKIITLLPLVAPPYIFAISLITLLGRNGIITNILDLNWDIYGFTGPVIAQTLAFLPLAYLMINNTLSSLNPNLEDTASSLGASEGKIIRSIIIPLLTPGLLKAALIVFVMSVSEFGNVAILAGRTPFLAPDTYTMITGEGNFNMASVLSMFLLLPAMVIFIIQNYMIKGKSYTTISGKPVAADPRHITPVILIPFLALSFIVCGLILVTFAVVGVGAFTKIVGVDNTFTLKNILDMHSNQAIFNSVKVSLLAALFGGMMGVLLGYVIIRGKFRGRAALEGISLAGFTLPGTVFGIGYLLTFNRPPLMLIGTMMILVINCVFRFLAVGEEAAITKLQQLSIEVEEASYNLGASAATTFRRIVLPIIFSAFMYGFMFVFMYSMISLSAVIFLVSPGYPLASISIFDAAIWGKIGLASATTLKLIGIVGICMLIANIFSKWTGLSTRVSGVT